MKKVIVLFLLLGFAACQQQQPDPFPTPVLDPSTSVALRWGQMTLSIMYQLPLNTPTYGSRSLGYAGLTMYECVVNGTTTHRSLAAQLSGLTALPLPESGQMYNYPLALNAGQAAILKNLFAFAPTDRLRRVDSLEAAINGEFISITQPDVVTRSASYGKAVAEAIFTWSKTDGGFEGYKRNFDPGYSFPHGAGYWNPPINGQIVSGFPLHPTWGKNRTFAPANSTLPVPEMTAYSTNRSSAYYKEFAAVYTKNQTLTPEEKAIAAWWGDDPTETFSPPGHSYNLANIVVKTAGPNLVKAAETYARVGMAVADGFVNCWKAKYTYHCERPSTYVRANIDPAWTQFWPEPPFPAFYSGHSVQSAASATVLEALYGTSFQFVDTSHQGRPRDQIRKIDYVPRTFNSFWATAEEAALSRFYGGIHTRQDNEIGLAEGKKIGQHINELTWSR
ncbi:vanadium-dependent haloperoxidase [uncultured Fibrella sp.]|uniref:vanadium-dependent haloperoxidase n=1 Tax=uncultured Fibrella sp. TaxID=1284596 RepID=UPI0035CC45B8